MIQNIQDLDLLKQFNKTYNPKSWLISKTYFEYLLSQGEKPELIGEFRNNSLISACLFNIVEAKRGKALQVFHGPIIPDFNSISYRQYLDFLKNIAKQKKCDFIRVNPLSPKMEQVDLVFKTNGFISTPFENMFSTTIQINIENKSIEEVYEGFSIELKENLQKLFSIEKKGDFRVEIVDELSDDCESLTEQQETEQHSFKNIQSVTNFFCSKGEGFVLKLYYRNELRAYQTFVINPNNGYVCNHHGAVIKSDLNYNLLIHYTALKKCIESGYTVYDFWGTAPKDKFKHPWRATTNFKSQFGGIEVEYLNGYDYALTPKYWLTNMYEKYQKIKRGH
ncbi:MAG: peptidoglycan bridge formation glycyltransferase FemA/FemB family protein [Patescibacteria group bacterium]